MHVKKYSSLKTKLIILLPILLLTKLLFASSIIPGETKIPRHLRSMLPSQLGYCEDKVHKIVNSELLKDENENLGFELNFSKLLKGKFQLAVQLTNSNDMIKDNPEIWDAANIAFSNNEMSQGLLFVNKAAFLTEKPSSRFFTIPAHQDQDFIEESLHGTRFLQSREYFSSDLIKIMKINFFLPNVEINFTQEISILDKNRNWSGSYKERGSDDTYIEKLFNLSDKQTPNLGAPKNIIVYDLVEADQYLKGSKSIYFYYEVKIKKHKYNLVLAYNIVSLDCESNFVHLVLEQFRHLCYKNIKREFGEFIDATRLFVTIK